VRPPRHCLSLLRRGAIAPPGRARLTRDRHGSKFGPPPQPGGSDAPCVPDITRRELLLKTQLAAVLGLALLVGCGSTSTTPSDAAGSKRDAALDGDIDVADTALGDALDGDTLSAPVVLARAPGCGAAYLALADGALYWTERSTGIVKSLAVTNPGGAPAILAINQPMPGPITADDAAVYWSNDGDHTIRKLPLAGGEASDGGAAPDGGAPAPFLTAPAVVSALLASGGFVYYGAGPGVYKVGNAGGAPLTLASFATCKTSYATAFAVDTDHLYQTDFFQQFVTRERLDGTQLAKNPCSATAATMPMVNVPDTISHSQGDILFDAISVAGGNVIWADSSNVYAKPVDGAMSLGAPLIASTAGANAITGFVVSGTSIYLGEGDNSGAGGNAIEAAPLDSGDAGEAQATVLATGQANPSQLVADASHVYWVTHTPSATADAADDCAIMSLAK
jgi:hypothetical protein